MLPQARQLSGLAACADFSHMPLWAEEIASYWDSPFLPTQCVYHIAWHVMYYKATFLWQDLRKYCNMLAAVFRDCNYPLGVAILGLLDARLIPP